MPQVKIDNHQPNDRQQDGQGRKKGGHAHDANRHGAKQNKQDTKGKAEWDGSLFPEDAPTQAERTPVARSAPLDGLSIPKDVAAEIDRRLAAAAKREQPSEEAFARVKKLTDSQFTGNALPLSPIMEGVKADLIRAGDRDNNGQVDPIEYRLLHKELAGTGQHKQLLKILEWHRINDVDFSRKHDPAAIAALPVMPDIPARQLPAGPGPVLKPEPFIGPPVPPVVGPPVPPLIGPPVPPELKPQPAPPATPGQVYGPPVPPAVGPQMPPPPQPDQAQPPTRPVTYNLTDFTQAKNVFEDGFKRAQEYAAKYGYDLEYKGSGMRARGAAAPEFSAIEFQSIIAKDRRHPDERPLELGKILPEKDHLKELKSADEIFAEAKKLIDARITPRARERMLST